MLFNFESPSANLPILSTNPRLLLTIIHKGTYSASFTAIKSGVAWYYYFNGWLERSLPKRRCCCCWPSDRCRNTDADIVPADVVFLCPMIFSGGRHVTDDEISIANSSARIRHSLTLGPGRPSLLGLLLHTLGCCRGSRCRHNHSHSHLTPSKCVITHHIFLPAAIPMASFIKWFDDYHTVPHKFMPYDFRQSSLCKCLKIRLRFYWRAIYIKPWLSIWPIYGATSSLAYLSQFLFF